MIEHENHGKETDQSKLLRVHKLFQHYCTCFRPITKSLIALLGAFVTYY